MERYKDIIDQVKLSQRSDELSYRIETLVVDLNALKGPAENLVSIDKFKEIVDKEASDIDIYFNDIVKGLEEYVRKYSALKRAVDEYERDFGEYTYDNVVICTPLEVKARYEIIAKKINTLETELNSAPEDKKGSLKARISSLKNLVNVLPNLLEDPSKFVEIQKEVDDVIKASIDDVKAAKEKLRTELQDFFAKTQTSLMEKLKNLDYSLVSDLENLEKNINGILDKYTLLSEDDKNDVGFEASNGGVELFPGVDEDLCNAIIAENGLLDTLHYSIEPLATLSFDDKKVEDFKKELINLSAVINNIKTNPVLSSHGIVVDYNKTSNVLDIKIPSIGISYSREVFNHDTYLNYQAYEIKKITDEYITVIEPMYEDAYHEAFRILSKMERYDESQIIQQHFGSFNFDEWIDKIVAFGVEKLKAESIIDNAAIRAKINIENKYAKSMKIDKFMFDCLIDKFAPIKVDISELAKLEYGTPEFETLYNSLQNKIKEFINFINTDENKKYGIEVTYDETSEKLGIDYHDSLLPVYSLEVLNNKALVAKNKAKSSGTKPAPVPSGDSGAPAAGQNPNPINPTGPIVPQGGFKPDPKPVFTDEQLQDQQVYIELMNIINEKIRELNGINNQLYTFEKNIDLTDEFVANNIRYEKQARNLDLEILSLKTELSTRRAQYARKYKQLLFSNMAIKNMKYEDIKFPVNYQEFVQKHDTLIVEAEMKIAELAEQQKSNPSAAAEVMNRINVLLEFIDSQNSVIGRSLIAESKVSNIDLVEMLQKRREFKKQLREQLRNKKGASGHGPDPINPNPGQIPGAQPINPVPVNPDPGQMPGAEPGDLEPPVVPPVEPPKPVEPSGVTISSKNLKFNPRKKPIIDRQYCSILTGVETLKVSVIKNGLKIKYSKDLAEKLHNVKNSLARLALVNKDNYRVRKSTQLDLAADDTEIETELSFKTKSEINPDDYKLEVRNDDGVIYEYDLADLPEEEKGKAR